MKNRIETIQKRKLANGLVVVGHPMDYVESVSFYFLLPGGVSRLPEGCGGSASVINDWLFRGAGPYSSRELIDALDGLGLHRNSSVSSEYLSFSVSCEFENLSRALELYAEILLRPKLTEDQFEPSRQLALNELKGLDDDPRHKVMLCLYEQFYPEPLGRSPMGTAEELAQLGTGRAREIFGELLHWPQGILAAAGKFDFDALCEKAEVLFTQAPQPKSTGLNISARRDLYRHIHVEGAQVHIGFMTETPPIGSGDLYQILAAASVLSGGMSSRLFTEVREKRGLCYAVGARYHTLKDFAGISGYAGTTPDKAQQTIEVILGEFERLRSGISEDELQRAKVGLKSGLIMQNELTSARAAGLAGDQFLLGRVRTLDEIREAIESLTVDSVGKFLADQKFKDFTIVTIGPRKLEI